MRSLAIFLLALLAAPALGFNVGIVAQARVVAPRTSPLLLQSEPPAAAADAAALVAAQLFGGVDAARAVARVHDAGGVAAALAPAPRHPRCAQSLH